MPFQELGLSSTLLKAVDDAGYSEPTPIQKRAIPYVLQGRDVLGSAQTGTGKTASFTLPMIDILSQGRARARMPRSLILEPTRELAAQVAENFTTYGKYHKLSMALLIGGVSFVDQGRIIDRGADVLIATPGRLLDHFERGGLLLRGVEILVIDESDRMLDMGFIPDVERIVQLCNPKRQTLFFSATMPSEIRRLAEIFLNDPNEISVAPPASPAETVDQTVTIVRPGDKDRMLRTLLRSQPVKNALIFCNRKRDVDAVAKSLKGQGLNALALHGDMQQRYRMQTLEKFKNNETKFLVCSDVAARGLDIQGLSHVFLYDVPIHADDYVHRIGRTGRAGMPGRSLTLATEEDSKYLVAVENLIGKPIRRYDPNDQSPSNILNNDDEPVKGQKNAGTSSNLDDLMSIKGDQENTKQTGRRNKPKSRNHRPKSTKINPDKKVTNNSVHPRSKGKHPTRRENAPVDKDTPRGMGDHVPAFLTRNTKRKK